MRYKAKVSFGQQLNSSADWSWVRGDHGKLWDTATLLRQALATHNAGVRKWVSWKLHKICYSTTTVFTGPFVQNLMSKLKYDVSKHVSGDCFVLHANTRTYERSAERKQWLSSYTNCDICGMLWVSVKFPTSFWSSPQSVHATEPQTSKKNAYRHCSSRMYNRSVPSTYFKEELLWD